MGLIRRNAHVRHAGLANTVLDGLHISPPRSHSQWCSTRRSDTLCTFSNRLAHQDPVTSAEEEDMSTERKGAEMDRPRESEEKTETDFELLPNTFQVGNVQVVMTTYARGNGENEGGQSSGDSAPRKRKASSRSPPSNQTELGDAVTVSAEELKKDDDDDDSTENKLRLPTIKLD